jgi:ribokinase
MTEDGPASLVLVVGDANPDLVLRGDVLPRFGQAEQLLTDAELVIGGSAAITAHGLARLGRPVALVAAIGRDPLGSFMRAELARAGVVIEHLLERVELPTGLSVVLSRGNDRAILTHRAAITTLSPAEIAVALSSLRVAGLRHLHISSLFLQPQLTDALPALLATARRHGVTTSLDTNDDPAGRWQGVEALLPLLDLLLPNRAEVIALAADTDVHRAAARLATCGPLVVVKDGGHGGFVVTPAGERVTADAPRVNPVDTTGAGDTFNAAFIDAWLDAHPLDICLQHAVRAGAHTVTALGGTRGQPSRDDLIPGGTA